MKKIFTLISFLGLTLNLRAQPLPPATPDAQAYGKIDIADLEMKSCDFEKDANAEVLFDKASVNTSDISSITHSNSFITSSNVVLEHHVRIKIFNDFGKNKANIRLNYFYQNFDIGITDIKAETFNLNNGEIEVTKLDKKLIYTEKIDRQHSAAVFSMPNVKAGSVIEYKYSMSIGYFPVWYFQSDLPTRYSEIETVFATQQDYKVIPHVRQSFVINKGFSNDVIQVRALANIHSLPEEPYTSGYLDNLQRIEYLILLRFTNTWSSIGNSLPGDYRSGGGHLSGEEDIISKAKTLKTEDEKIDYIFDVVRNTMKWNNKTTFYTTDGTGKAWSSKTGTSSEINLIVYHLLKKLGVKSFPLIVGSKITGKLDPVNPGIFHFSNMLVYVPIGNTKYYVLDATDKYNLFNIIPNDVLNTSGFCIDADNKEYTIVFLENKNPVMQSVFLNAEINGDGKMSGSMEMNCSGYNKVQALKKYKTDGEEKFVKYLRGDDNNLNITSLKLDDMEVDSLPLTIKANFSTDPGNTDENYIYLKTNLFSLAGTNPFISENRFSDINFGYLNDHSVNEIYQLPGGYKPDVLPKSVTIVMPDQSIIFKRFVAAEDGKLLIKYTLTHKKTFYFAEDYQDLRGFYKKMYELLSEQVVLKKSS